MRNVIAVAVGLGSILISCSGEEPPFEGSRPGISTGTKHQATEGSGAEARSVLYEFRATDGDRYVVRTETFRASIDSSAARLTAVHDGVTGPGFEFKSSTIERGGFKVAFDGTSPELDGGDVILKADEIAVVLRASERGLQWVWNLAEPPKGEGDLTVSLALSEMVEPGELTRHGLHYLDAVTGLGVRVQASWEAAGTSVALEVEGSAATTSVRLPESMLDISEYPASIVVSFVPSEGVDQPLGIPARAPIESIAAAALDQGTFVVWADDRFGTGDTDIVGQFMGRRWRTRRRAPAHLHEHGA